VPELFNPVRQFLVAQLNRDWTTKDNNIDSGQFILPHAKTLAHEPFNTVTLYCSAGALLGYSQTQARETILIGTGEKRDCLVTDTSRFGKNTLVMVRCGKSGGTGK
jgi:hypothetical protein